MCGCNRAKLVAAGVPSDGVIGTRQIQESVPSIPTVDTSVWGPPTWIALHIASVASFQNISLWKELLIALQNDIPCPDCREHYSEWIRTHPFRTASLLPIRRMMARRAATPLKIVQWLLDLHNDVCSRLGRPTWNEQQVLERFGGDRNAEGRASLETVRGILGGTSFDILMRLLA